MEKFNSFNVDLLRYSSNRYDGILQNISKNILSVLEGFSSKKKALIFTMFLSISPSIAFGNSQYQNIDIDFKGDTQSLTIRAQDGTIVGYLEKEEAAQAMFDTTDIKEISIGSNTINGISIKLPEEKGYISISENYTNINDYLNNSILPRSGSLKDGINSLKVRDSSGETIEWLTKENIDKAKFFPDIKRRLNAGNDFIDSIKVENVDGSDGYVSQDYINFENNNSEEIGENLENAFNGDFNNWLSNEVKRRKQSTLNVFEDIGYINIDDFEVRLQYVSDLINSFEDKTSLFNFLEFNLRDKFERRSNISETLSINIDNYFTQVRLSYQSQLKKEHFGKILDSFISYELSVFEEDFINNHFDEVSEITRQEVSKLKTNIENELLRVSSLLKDSQQNDKTFNYWLNVFKEKYNIKGSHQNNIDLIKEIFHKIRAKSQSEALNGNLGELKNFEEHLSEKKQRIEDEIEFVENEIKESHGFSNWSHQVNVAMNSVALLSSDQRTIIRQKLKNIYLNFRNTVENGGNAFDILRKYSNLYNININTSPYSSTSFTYRIRHLFKEIAIQEKDNFVNYEYNNLYNVYDELKNENNLENRIKESINSYSLSNLYEKMNDRIDLTHNFAKEFLSEDGLNELDKKMKELFYIGMLSDNPSNFFYNYSIKLGHDNYIPTTYLRKSSSIVKNFDSALTMLRVSIMRDELGNMSGDEYLKLEEEYGVNYIISVYKITSNLEEYKDNIDLNKKFSSMIFSILDSHPAKENILNFFGTKEKAEDFILKLINIESKGLTFIHAGNIGTNSHNKALGPIQALKEYRYHYNLNPFNNEEVIKTKFDQIVNNFFTDGGELRYWKDHPNRINIAYQAQISGPTGTKNAINQCGVYDFYKCFSYSNQQYNFLQNIDKSTERARNSLKLLLNDSFEGKYKEIQDMYPQLSISLSNIIK